MYTTAKTLALCVTFWLLNGTSPATAEALTEVIEHPEMMDCSRLNVSIFWFGKDNLAEQASALTAKGSRFFDPRKPTLLFAHGHAYDAVRKNHRKTFLYELPDGSTPIDTAAPWIDAGWNVGIFNWQQMADEPTPWMSEGKIWSAATSLGTRWRQCDGSWSTQGAPNASVTDLYERAYLEAMAYYSGPEVRLLGHSLGAQLTINLDTRLRSAVSRGRLPHELQPKRLALLDPFWSTGNEAQAWPGSVGRELVQATLTQPDGPVWEIIRTTDLLLVPAWIDRNDALFEMIGELHFYPDFLLLDDPIQTIVARHNHAFYAYMLSLQRPIPLGCNDSGCNEPLMAASQSTERSRELMLRPTRWEQATGKEVFVFDKPLTFTKMGH